MSSDCPTEIYSDQLEDIPDSELMESLDTEPTPSPKPKPQKIERPKRPMPAKMLENQKKYEENLEKQRSVQAGRKGKGSAPHARVEASKPSKVRTTTDAQEMRRVIIAGKVRYIPIKKTEETGSTETTSPTPQSPSKIIQAVEPSATEPKAGLASVERVESEPEAKSKPLPPSIARAAEKHAKAQALLQEHPATRKQNKNQRGSRMPAGTRNKIPDKYAKHMEQEARKQTQNNIRSFADLRRAHEMQAIDPNNEMDIGKASIQELRRIKIEQRRKAQEELKKGSATNKRKSAVQEILDNNSMTGFGKMVAIKNLSASSRAQRRPLVANQAAA